MRRQTREKTHRDLGAGEATGREAQVCPEFSAAIVQSKIRLLKKLQRKTIG